MIANEADAQAWLTAMPECDAVAKERLARLATLLIEENDRQNLVARTSIAELWRRHMADSAQLLLHVPRGTASWLDLGTGAGFPGMVIAILRPETAVAMIESRTRRAEWLERARLALGLDKAVVCHTRLERMETRKVDVVSARAFAPLDRLVELSARFSTSNTIWLLPKGRSAQHELNELRGWRHAFHVEHSLTDPRAGIIVGTLAGRKDVTA